MRKSLVCPKCQGRRFYEIQRVMMADDDSTNASSPLTLAAPYVLTGEMQKVPFLGSVALGNRLEAEVSAWVCAGCAYTELYARDLSLLARLVELRVPDVRVVDGAAPSAGPHR